MTSLLDTIQGLLATPLNQNSELTWGIVITAIAVIAIVAWIAKGD